MFTESKDTKHMECSKKEAQCLNTTTSEGKTPLPHLPPQTKAPWQPMDDHRSQEPETKVVEAKTPNPPQQEPDVRPNKVNPPFKKNQWNDPPGIISVTSGAIYLYS